MELPHIEQSYRLIPRKKYLFVLSLVALGLSLIEIFHIVQLPFDRFINGAGTTGSFLSLDLLSIMTTYGYVSLFILMTLESASIPIPSEIVLPIAGYLVYAGVMGFPQVLVVSVAALMIGALIDYYLGLKLGRPFLNKMVRWFRLSPRQAQKAEDWINTKGTWSVFVARFIPVLRAVISIPAGILEMRLKSFLLMTFLGSLGWSALLTYIGYSAGPLWKAALGSFSLVLNQIILFSIAGLSILYIVYYFASRRRVRTGAGDSVG